MSSDPQLEYEVCAWIEAITETTQEGSAHEWLRDGKVLCALINKVKPQAKVKANKMARPFMMRENITMFLRACRKEFPRIKEGDMFSTDDLYDAKDMGQVMKFIYSFGGVVQTDPECNHLPALGVAQTAKTKMDQRSYKDLGQVDLSAGFSKSSITEKPTSFVGGRPANVVNETGYNHGPVSQVSTNSINSSFKAANSSINKVPSTSVVTTAPSVEPVQTPIKQSTPPAADLMAGDDDEDSAAEEVAEPGSGYFEREKQAYTADTPSAYPPSP